MDEFKDQPAGIAWCHLCQATRETFITKSGEEFWRCCARCSRVLARGATPEQVGGHA